MHDFASSPRKLSLDLPSHSAQKQKMEKYKNNMQIFVRKVEEQMSKIVDKYQSRIKKLEKQNIELRKQLNHNPHQSFNQQKSRKSAHTAASDEKFISHRRRSVGLDKIGLQQQLKGFNFQNISQVLSPIKKTEGQKPKPEFPLLKLDSLNSNFVEGLPIRSLFSIQEAYSSQRKKQGIPNYKFELDSSMDHLRQSKFQRQSSKNKQRQELLVNSLEMGKSNLDENTTKMFSLIGKNKKKQNPQNQETHKKQVQLKLKKKRSDADMHNTSLSSICDSLNNSFHGRKAQAKNKKKKKEQQVKMQEQKQKQRQQQKMLKEQGVKNLLKGMRNNIQLAQEPQIIKASKLLITGEKNRASSAKSKVMINPVPVDLGKKKQASENFKGVQSNIVFSSSPTKQPQSILKNSGNVLTRSISNISAISFHESGGQQ